MSNKIRAQGEKEKNCRGPRETMAEGFRCVYVYVSLGKFVRVSVSLRVNLFMCVWVMVMEGGGDTDGERWRFAR